MNQPQYNFQIITLGEWSVGKKSLLKRIADGVFIERYMPGSGIEFYAKSIVISGIKTNLIFLPIQPDAPFFDLKAIHAALIVFDLSQKESFNAIEGLLEKLTQNIPEEIPTFLIGAKADLDDQKVTQEEIESFTQSTGLKFYKTSAKTGQNVDRLFYDLAKVLIKIQELQ
ncbi:MAG: Rab family GTPase [Candidatus Hodarchaeota archaeon]